MLSQHDSVDARFFATRWQLWQVSLDGTRAAARPAAGRRRRRVAGLVAGRRLAALRARARRHGRLMRAPRRHACSGRWPTSATASGTTATTAGRSAGRRSLSAMTVRVRLFAGLRERAAGPSASSRQRPSRTSGAALELGDEPAGLLYAVNREYAKRDRALADGDEVALIPPVSGGAFLLSRRAAVARPRRRRGARRTRPARSRRSPAPRGARRAAAASPTSSTRRTRGWPSRRCGDRRGAARALQRDGRGDPPSHRPSRHRRDVRRDRRLGAAPRRCARGLPRRDRRVEGAGAALEERGLRRRRRVDRPRLMSYPDGYRDYEPIHPRGTDWRGIGAEDLRAGDRGSARAREVLVPPAQVRAASSSRSAATR